MTVAALVICILIGITGVISSEDTKYCSLGPLYQCQAVNLSQSCNAFEHCKTLWKQGSSYLMETLNDFECQFCEILMTDLRDALKSKATEDDIIDAVNKLCLKIPQTSVQQACQLMANMYLRTVLSMLANDIEPRLVCRTIHMCPGPAYVPQNLTSLLSMAFHLRRHGESNSLALGTDPSQECSDCKRFMSDLRERFIGNATARDVKDYLNQTICPYMPCQPMRMMCEHAVQLFVDDVLKLLREQLDPETDCILIGFCSGGDLPFLRQSLLRLLAQYPAKLPESFENEKCDICKELVQKGLTLLDQPDVQMKIGDMLKSEFCAKLPMIRYECERYITIYVPVVVRVLRNEVTPNALCEELDACPTARFFSFSKLSPKAIELKRSLDANSDTNNMPSIIKASPTIDEKVIAKSFVGSPMGHVVPTCEFCKLVIEAIEKRLPVVRTEAMVVKAMEEVCVILPGKTGKRCDELVKLYGDKIAKLLVEFMAPHLICMSLELCPFGNKQKPVSPILDVSNEGSNTIVFNPLPASNPSITWGALFSPKIQPTNNFLCTLCKSIVTQADKFLKQNQTDEEIETKLDSWCRTLSQTWSPECINLAHQYIPLILDTLADDADPNVVCSKIELCPSQQKFELIREKRRCALGPNVWCSNLITAHRCRATTYCQKNVWHGKAPPKTPKQM